MEDRPLLQRAGKGQLQKSEQDRYLRLLEDTARVLEPHGTALSVNHWHSIMHADLGKRNPEDMGAQGGIAGIESRQMLLPALIQRTYAQPRRPGWAS